MTISPRLASLVAVATAAALSIAACGSSGPAAKITASAAATTTAATTNAATTVATPTSAAAGTARSTTVAGGGSSTSADPSSSIDPATELTTLGLSASEAACVKGKVDLSKVDITSDNPGPAFYRGLYACAPDWFAKEFGSSFSDQLPAATPDQLTCIGKATLGVLMALDDKTLDTALSSAKFSDMAADVRTKVLATASKCGISAADLEKAFNAG